MDDLKGVKLESGALSTLQTDVKNVQSSADAVVGPRRSRISPSQTSALKSSVSSLSAAVNQLPASPTAQQLAPLRAYGQQRRDGCEGPQ